MTTTESTALASQAGHWYTREGKPMYEVEAKQGRVRPATLADARKLDLVPSVTLILKVAASPGLEAWRATQLLQAALTLPKLPDETVDDYAKRVIEDSREQGRKAAERGTELHKTIEEWIQGQMNFQGSTYYDHIENLQAAALQHGIDLTKGRAEHSFASPLGYGGKIDFHNDEPLIIDFKTKDRIDDGKQLSWPEHAQQLAAYGFGLQSEHIRLGGFTGLKFRALNVFIGIEDKKVRVIEHEWTDIVEAFAQFRLLLEYWHRIKRFGTYSK